MAAKKTRKTQVLTTRLVILIGTLVLLMLGALFLTKTSISILITQGHMISYYNDIEEAEANHDYYYEMALMSPSASGYMETAEEYDAIVMKLTRERNYYIANATDPTVIWACRDGVEFLTILAGLVEFLISISLWGLSVYLILAAVLPIWVKRRNAIRRHTSMTSRRSYHSHRQDQVNSVISSRSR